MGKKFILYLFLLFYSEKSEAQNDIKYRILSFVKEFDIDSAELILKDLDQSIVKETFRHDLLYYKKGKNSIEFLRYKNNNSVLPIDLVILYNYLGDYYSRINKTNVDFSLKTDSLSHSFHKKAYLISKSINDSILINESLRRINRRFITNDIDIISYKTYVDEISKYPKDSVDLFWEQYFKSMFLLSKYEYPYNGIEEKLIEESFLKLKKITPNISYHNGLLNHSLGMIYSFFNNNETSHKYYDLALDTYDENVFYSYQRKINTIIAKDMLISKLENPLKGINNLKRHLKNKFIENDDMLQYVIYDRLHKLYKLSNKDSSDYYLKLQNEKVNTINSLGVALVNNEIDINDSLNEIKNALELKEVENKNLQLKFMAILPFLSAITFLLIIIFSLYKRYRKKSDHLEKDQSETLQKLDELKNIVIKNHITLKDKTKIYISDLMYIKSDDHYLNIYLSNGKNHFVRGKLSQMKEELPPNFIQCHRSYIVNSNFIKQANGDSLTLLDKTQIPLSRSYKDKF
jgi:hypothetical protein